MSQQQPWNLEHTGTIPSKFRENDFQCGLQRMEIVFNYKMSQEIYVPYSLSQESTRGYAHLNKEVDQESGWCVVQKEEIQPRWRIKGSPE